MTTPKNNRQDPVKSEELDPAKDVTAADEVQALKTENEEIKAENAQLSGMLAKLSERLDAVEAQQAPEKEEKIQGRPVFDSDKPHKKHRNSGGFEYEQDGQRFSGSGEHLGKVKRGK